MNVADAGEEMMLDLKFRPPRNQVRNLLCGQSPRSFRLDGWPTGFPSGRLTDLATGSGFFNNVGQLEHRGQRHAVHQRDHGVEQKARSDGMMNQRHAEDQPKNSTCADEDR